MKRLVCLAVCFLTSLAAQYPPEIKWKKIRTPHFDIVFPSDIEADAARAANALETLYGPLSKSLGALPKRTTVLLSTQNVTRYSGGSVSLFPRMATFNAMPMQGFWGTNDWITVLAAQEGRHLVQIAKMNHGFGKLAGMLFGEAGTATVLGWTIPDWWLYGDARVAETTMLRGGVGQFASSEMTTRAMLLSGEHFSFMKAIHGSYRDNVPSQAELGAFLVSHVDRTSNPDAWNQILARAAKNSWNPFALSVAMKKETGRSAATNYTEAMSQLSELYNSKLQQTEFSRPNILTPDTKRAFTGYYQPVAQADGSVIAQKSGLDTYPMEVVRIRPDGKQQRLFRFAPSVNGSNHTSVAHGRMVWDTYVPDIRWLRGYSEIMIRDLDSGRTHRLTHHARFMNPVLSPDGARVAVVEFLPNRQCSLVVLDAANGQELRRLPSPDNDMIYTPAWSEDGLRLAMIMQSGRGRALSIVEVESGSFTDVIPHANLDLANPVFYRTYVLYKASESGAVNIFAVEAATGSRYRVTNAKFGADFPAVSPDGTKLIYSDYTAQGYNVAELPLDPKSWTAVESLPDVGLGYHGAYRDYSAEIPGTAYPADRYRPSLHLFEVHSWGFTSGPPDLGFGVMSNDKMHLMDFHASMLYNTNERAAGFTTGASYSRFFPVLDLNFSDRNRHLQFADHEDKWTERTAQAGFHIPLNLSRGYYYTGLSIGANVESVTLHGRGLVPLTYGLGFAHVRQSSARDLAPPWAQTVGFTYRQTPWSNGYTGNFLSTSGRYLMPGLMRHHSLRFEGGYERQRGNYYFSSQLVFPRGYDAVVAPDLRKISTSYLFPLLYPDWAIGQLAYVKRISGNVFYDYGEAGNRLYRSTGLEMLFDVSALHFPDTLRVGVRYAYRLDYRNARVEPFFAYRW